MSIVGDTNVHVRVDGTTFSAIYETVGSIVVLTSADFGDRSAENGGHDPLLVAERLLRAMAEQAISGGTLFLRDDGTVRNPAKSSNV